MPPAPALDRRSGVVGLLAAAVEGFGGAPRAGQRTMAAAVEEAIETGEHLLVQAGTGTGKSLGYLVPLVAHAVTTGTTVVVSTATLALQAQIAQRDLPRLADALAPHLGRRPTVEVVKGRANYVCRHKLVGGFPADDEGSLFEAVPAAASPTSRLGREVARLRAWAEETTTGEREELSPGVSDRAWRQVSVSARECLGAQRCPVAADCHVEASRARAREADVVVTNHALLAIDAFEDRPLLPEHDVVVVDEAHELADRVTSAVSGALSGTSAAAAATAARRRARADTARLETAAEDLSAVLEGLPAGRFATGLPEGLLAAVAAVRDAAREALSSLRPEPGSAAEADAAARQVARAALSEVFDVAERLAEVEAGGPDVAWLAVTEGGSASARRTSRALHVAPLSVAGMLREKLFATRTVVMTSATLALGGAFDTAAGAVGLRGTGAPSWTGMDVGSPFDYPRQAILYTAAHLPPPGRDGAPPAVLDELAALVEAAGGRTLGLFSSRRAAEAAAAAMRERLDVPVLCQGEDSTASLVRRFAEDEATCLFGTLGLWQGVDVPGPSCQLVVLDRIPFPRPDDPLASARAEAAARAGANGFLSVSATHAALLMAQGAGRLVRSTTDRGVVAVLDSRLATARYAGFLRASLPPLWPTTDREVVLGALRRLSAAGSRAPAASPTPR
ncbi:ATP-dependent DNA helicase [Quadrisphaera sp. DSM 44207]|uniref:ATP-dependent DNA helicase n=1 Tax=Quadrisphaera sp. DSM 44207 TaxID=1881057 RepID=UPI00088D7C4C|nr:ATP-dependent DNA helicase [Quadrisphaera sp. DSM 44207]SDQ34295.1 ATP-dependent DNA helicase DinG [Quadrisphaera sp. DSM 44207]